MQPRGFARRKRSCWAAESSNELKHARAKLHDLLHSIAPGAPVPPQRFETAAYISRLRAFNASANYAADLRRVVELVEPVPGMKVLDFGCGLGAATAALAGLGCEATGVDTSRTALEAAAREHPGAVFLEGPILPHAQDAVIALHTLSYVSDAPGAVDALYEALRPGGRLVMCEPNPLFVMAMLPYNLFNDYLPDENLVFCRGSRSWRRILWRAGFRSIWGERTGEFPGVLRIDALRSRSIFVAHKVGGGQPQ